MFGSKICESIELNIFEAYFLRGAKQRELWHAEILRLEEDYLAIDGGEFVHGDLKADTMLATGFRDNETAGDDLPDRNDYGRQGALSC